MSTLEALRAKANIEGRQAFLTQFRADFKAMFAHWRQTGQISEVEAMQQYKDAARAVQERMHDNGWIEAAAAHFRQLCIDTERDDERSRRIKAEVQAEKQAAEIEDMKKRHGGRAPV